MDRNEASALADLQMHWDEAYVIGFDGDVWSARFRRSTDLLCARTSSDLRELIRADYVHRQRPRPLARLDGPAHGSDDAVRVSGPSGHGTDHAEAGHTTDGDEHPAVAAGPTVAATATAPTAPTAAADPCAAATAPTAGADPAQAASSAQVDGPSPQVADALGPIDFASIRGERMST